MQVPAWRLTAALTRTPPLNGPVSVVSTAVAAPRSTESPTAETFQPLESTTGCVVGTAVVLERGRVVVAPGRVVVVLEGTVGGEGMSQSLVSTQSPPPTAVWPPTSWSVSGGWAATAAAPTEVVATRTARPATCQRRCRARRRSPVAARRFLHAAANAPLRTGVSTNRYDTSTTAATRTALTASVGNGDAWRSRPGRVNSKTAIPQR